MQWIMYNTHTHTHTYFAAKFEAQTALSKALIINWKICAQRISSIYALCTGWNGRRKQWFTQKLGLCAWFRFIKYCHTLLSSHVCACVCVKSTWNYNKLLFDKIIIESLLRYVSLHHQFALFTFTTFFPLFNWCMCVSVTRIKWNIEFFPCAPALRRAPICNSIINLY